ncbi:hypothetical protein RRG08_043730 [Elysia crispata]|uniref:Uncharacterized protein n=1 Tax=Elysia crispata TaxID=231223 RepID=A0AAE1DJW3_9GAST|nr:hypothetical protein RRG08_043730 [Elysia crispata]
MVRTPSLFHSQSLLPVPRGKRESPLAVRLFPGYKQRNPCRASEEVVEMDDKWNVANGGRARSAKPTDNGPPRAATSERIESPFRKFRECYSSVEYVALRPRRGVHDGDFMSSS